MSQNKPYIVRLVRTQLLEIEVQADDADDAAYEASMNPLPEGVEWGNSGTIQVAEVRLVDEHGTHYLQQLGVPKRTDVESEDAKLRRAIVHFYKEGNLSILSITTGIPVQDLIDIAEGGEIDVANRIILEAAVHYDYS